MRKKSHISLARYIVNSLDDKELKKHRFSFYMGSVLPDIKPSFIYKRHEINGTFPYVKTHVGLFLLFGFCQFTVSRGEMS